MDRDYTPRRIDASRPGGRGHGCLRQTLAVLVVAAVLALLGTVQLRAGSGCGVGLATSCQEETP